MRAIANCTQRARELVRASEIHHSLSGHQGRGFVTATIRLIRIENFRSIRSLEADLSRFAIFVGKNDSGKSNILRALNLFFNGYTNPGTEFSFDED